MTLKGVNIFWSYYLKIVNHKTDVTGGTKYLPPPPLLWPNLEYLKNLIANLKKKNAGALIKRFHFYGRFSDQR